MTDPQKPKNPISRSEPLHKQIAHNIRNQITAGVLRDGQALDSTRVLAEQWGVSVYTISEAVKILVEEGLIESKDRSSRIVVSPNESREETIKLEQLHVLLVGGFAGSGKTEFSRIMARKTDWALLDKDTVSRPLTEKSLTALGCSPHDRESETYLKHVRPREYEVLIDSVRENVECGNSVVASAPFIAEMTNAGWFERTKALFDELDAKLVLVWMSCDGPTMNDYIRHRGAARDTVKLESWDDYLASIDLEARPVGPHIVIENSADSKPLQAQAEDLLKTLIGESG